MKTVIIWDTVPLKNFFHFQTLSYGISTSLEKVYGIGFKKASIHKERWVVVYGVRGFHYIL